MRSWYPLDNCPPGPRPCCWEIVRATDEPIGAVHLCPYHASLRAFLSEMEVHHATLISCQRREAARAAAKKVLGLPKKHPGVWFRIERDGSFTLGVNQRGKPMWQWAAALEPTWPSNVSEKHEELHAAMWDAVEKIQPVPGTTAINNLAHGKALVVGAQSASLTLASADEYSLIGFGNDSATEANTQVSATEAMTFSKLATRVTAGNSGTATFQFRKDTGGGAANGNQQIQITGTGAAEESDGVVDSCNAGDLFNIAYTDTGSSSSVPWSRCIVEFASGHGCFHGAATFPGNVHDVASATRFIGLTGNIPIDGQATEANVQWKNWAYTSWVGLQARCSANARTNNSDFINRINGSTGAGLCRFATLTTGLVTDTTIGDALAKNDLINYGITLGTGVEDLTVNFVSGTFKSTLGGQDIMSLDQAGLVRAASATANFFPFGGFPAVGAVLTDAQARIKPGFPGQLEFPRVYLSANTYTGAGATEGTFKIYKNGSAVMTVALTAAGGAGWYQDSAAIPIPFNDTDEFSFEFDEGNAGSATIHSFGVSLMPLPGPFMYVEQPAIIPRIPVSYG